MHRHTFEPQINSAMQEQEQTTAERPSDATEASPRVVTYASTAVQLGAAALLGGGALLLVCSLVCALCCSCCE